MRRPCCRMLAGFAPIRRDQARQARTAGFPTALPADIIRVGLKVPNWLAPTPDKRGRCLVAFPCKRGGEEGAVKTGMPPGKMSQGRKHDETRYTNGIDGR